MRVMLAQKLLKKVKLYFNDEEVKVSNFTQYINMYIGGKGECKRIHEKYDIELQVIYDKSLGTWRRGRPNIKVVEIDWTLNNVINYISKSDIGIVPCTNNFFLDAPINYANPFSLFIKCIINLGINFSGY